MRLRPAAVVAAAVLGVVAVGTASGATFTDPTGDVVVAPAGATLTGLDVTAVDLTNTPTSVTARITLAGSPTLPASSLIGLAFDLDKNVSTGDEGLEALVAYVVDDMGVASVVFEKYSALAGVLVDAPADAISASYANGVFEVTAPRSELFDTAGFEFVALSLVTTSDVSVAAIDVAPDEGGTYDLVGVKPPVPPKIVASRPVGVPAVPRAGKRFEVRSLATRADTKLLVSSGSVSCSVRVGAAKLAARGSFGATGARCAMTVPKNATGKLLRGTITIRSTGLTAAKRTFSFRVR